VPFPASRLSQENILRDVHDTSTQSLRTTAQATIVVPGGLEVDIDHTSDSIRIGDGTNLITSTSASGKVGLDVNIVNSSETTLQSILTELTAKTEPSDAQNIRALNVLTDSISAPNVETKLDNLLTELQLKADLNEAQNIRNLSSLQDSVSVPELTTTNTLLSSIEASLSSPLQVNLDAFTGTPDSVQLVGSNDGLSTGAKFGIVYNIRKAILDAEDRESDIAYADFGTKNQRVLSITYTSPTFPGRTAIKQLTYSLVGNRYRRDSIDWIVT